MTEKVVRFVANIDDKHFVVRLPNGSLKIEKDRTNWTRLDSMTDEEIQRSIIDDPDWASFKNVDWSKAELIHPRVKTPISIRLDPEVLDFFKAEGPGYQRRINTVLRHYVSETRKSRTRVRQKGARRIG
jgi:uncharacterized protein (DUF4415 family)